MKKIVFALIAVLLIGTFVACDGEADFLLWDDEPAGPKTITIDLSKTNSYYFDEENTETERTFTFPAGTTWQDVLDDDEFELHFYTYYYSIQVEKFNYEGTVGLKVDDGYYCPILSLMDGDVPLNLTDEVKDGTYYVDSCSINLYLDSGNWSFTDSVSQSYYKSFLLESKVDTWESLIDNFSIVLYKYNEDTEKYDIEVPVSCTTSGDFVYFTGDDVYLEVEYEVLPTDELYYYGWYYVQENG